MKNIGHMVLPVPSLCRMDTHKHTPGLWLSSCSPGMPSLPWTPVTSSSYSPPPPLQVPVLKPMDLMVEVSPRRVFANGHTYHINSISVNSDCETYMSADDLRINLWHLAVTDRSFSILSRTISQGASGRGVLAQFCFYSVSSASEAPIWNPDELIYENSKSMAVEGYI